MKILAFKELRRNSLLGFADVELSSGMIIRGVTAHETNGRRWAAPPGIPMLDENKEVIRNPDGRVSYAQVIAFVSREVGDAFSAQVLAALDAYLGVSSQERPQPGMSGRGR